MQWRLYVNVILDGGESLSADRWAHLDEMKTFMRQFTWRRCSYVPREYNKVAHAAHELANFAIRNSRIGSLGRGLTTFLLGYLTVYRLIYQPNVVLDDFSSFVLY